MSRLQQQAIVIGDSFNNTLGLIRSLGEAKVDIVLLLVGDDRLLMIACLRCFVLRTRPNNRQSFVRMTLQPNI